VTDRKTAKKGKPGARVIDATLLESLVGYNLRRAAVRQRERFRNVFAPFDIRPVQLTALTLILYNDRLGQSNLGHALGMKRANVVKLLDELQARSLIERKPSKRDRRAYDVHLTAEGQKFTKKLLAVHQKLEADLAESIGEKDLKRLIELLGKFRQVDPEPTLD